MSATLPPPSPSPPATGAWSRRLHELLSLRDGTDLEGAAARIHEGMEFTPGNTWALVFAILIASVGLNVNSTAVIIGAMLISPLMGPIVATGFGLATHDGALVRRAMRNLALATVVALLASTVYFAVSPLGTAQSELLARTRPTLYDVLIAIFGGGAGAVALTRRKTQGQVLPGVAIATALMPPLCTAGFGLSQGQWGYFFGALHLYLINALFIGLSTLGMTRLMRFPVKSPMASLQVWQVRLVVGLLALSIAIPSVYTGWHVIQEARFEQAARHFVAENFDLPGQVRVQTQLHYDAAGGSIVVSLLGKRLSNDTMAALQRQLPAYGLDHVKLEVQQLSPDAPSVEQVGALARQGVIDELLKRDQQAIAERDERIRQLEQTLTAQRAAARPVANPLPDLAQEMAALEPTLVSLAGGPEVVLTEANPLPAGVAAASSTSASVSTGAASAASAPGGSAASLVLVATWRGRLPPLATQERLRRFAATRLQQPSVRLVHVLLASPQETSTSSGRTIAARKTRH
jgi:uncharacterized hydrophobic protein (TIGR00271 family)